jgi:hypothetical protein
MLNFKMFVHHVTGRVKKVNGIVETRTMECVGHISNVVERRDAQRDLVGKPERKERILRLVGPMR